MVTEGMGFAERRAAKKGLRPGEFLVDAENIGNIQRQGYYGADGIDIGYAASWIGDGFCVRKLDGPDLDKDMGFERE